MRILIDLLSTPWVGTVLAIISLAAAAYFYRKSKSVSRLSYQADEITVVGGATAAFPQDLEIRFGGVVVPRVTATRAILWNAGNTTIRGDQIVGSDPLRFAVPDGCTILRASVAKRTREANAVSLAAEGNSVLVSFDYLDPNDGVAIGIFHSADRRQITCSGTLRGLSGGPTFAGPSREGFDRRMRRTLPFRLPVRVFGVVALVVGVGLILFGTFFKAILKSQPEALQHPIDLSWFLVGLGVLYSLIPLSIFWLTRRRHPKALDHSSAGDNSAS
jgi:hypothetical protein